MELIFWGRQSVLSFADNKQVLSKKKSSSCDIYFELLIQRGLGETLPRYNVVVCCSLHALLSAQLAVCYLFVMEMTNFYLSANTVCVIVAQLRDSLSLFLSHTHFQLFKNGH